MNGYPSRCQRCQERWARYWVIEQLSVFIPPALVCEECWRETDQYRTPDHPDCRMRRRIKRRTAYPAP